MNHERRPGLTWLYLLGTVLLIGIVIALTVPGSLKYVLVGLAVAIHFGLHGAHGHGAHRHGAHSPGSHGHAGAQGTSRADDALDGGRTLHGDRAHPAHGPYTASSTVVDPTSTRAARESPIGVTTAGDEQSADPKRCHGHGGRGGHRCC